MNAWYTAHFTKIRKGIFVTESIPLTALSAEHKDVLKKLFELYSQGDWVHYNNEMQKPENMRALGCEFFNEQYWWNEETTGSAIYKILEDMDFVLCIRQGLMAHANTSYMDENEKVLREFLQLP